MKDYYKLLHLKPDASLQQVESAYQLFRKNVTAYLPPGSSADTDELMQKQFPDVVAAYKTLMNPELRFVYDKEWRLHFMQEETQPIPERVDLFKPVTYNRVGPAQKGERVIVIFNRWTRLRKIMFGLILFAIAGSVVIFFLHHLLTGLRETLHTSANDGTDFGQMLEHAIEVLPFVLVGISAVLLALHFLVPLIYPFREVVFRNGQLFLRLKNGKEEVLNKIVFYKTLFVDFVFVNYFTAEGRKIMLYTPAGSCYSKSDNADEIAAWANQSGASVTTERFRLYNPFLTGESVPGKTKNGTAMLLNVAALFIFLCVYILLIVLMVNVVMESMELKTNDLVSSFSRFLFYLVLLPVSLYAMTTLMNFLSMNIAKKNSLEIK